MKLAIIALALFLVSCASAPSPSRIVITPGSQFDAAGPTDPNMGPAVTRSAITVYGHETVTEITAGTCVHSIDKNVNIGTIGANEHVRIVAVENVPNMPIAGNEVAHYIGDVITLISDDGYKAFACGGPDLVWMTAAPSAQPSQ